MSASGVRSMLPELTAEERSHSDSVAALIRAEIDRAGGWLSFERFMELALYAPGLGDYSAGSIKLGAGGDFVTAPEVSELFGRCLARQCLEVLRGTGGGSILELGAGTGALAAVLLEALDAQGALPDRYAILEVSADLAARQRTRLAGLAPHIRERIVWLERLPVSPLRGVILANEVADALPCRRFTIEAGAVRELGVALAADGALTSAAGAPDAVLAAACEPLVGTPPRFAAGYTSEVCLQVGAWIATLSDCLARGTLLLLDYGLPRSHYYHPQRVSGTLRCHFRQRAHDDPLINLGLQDITAWVEFTRVAEAASDAGLEVAGFATQAAFLLALGLEALVAEAADPITHARLAGEARRLIMPEEMGEAFKAMALTRGSPMPLAGFTLQDLRRQL
jgi:SAM-dependent MidA family methyltransferase